MREIPCETFFIGAGILFMLLFPLIVYIMTSSTKWLIASVVSIFPIVLAIIYMKNELYISADKILLTLVYISGLITVMGIVSSRGRKLLKRR